jgi:hypothetical protein
MERWPWFMMVAIVVGCINGAPLPPTPASSLAVIPAPDRAAQEAQYIEMARNYLREQGKDPTQATYVVHRRLRRDEDEATDQTPISAVVEVNFLNGAPWQLAVKADGDVIRLNAPRSTRR